jgi:hypothetical protein
MNHDGGRTPHPEDPAEGGREEGEEAEARVTAEQNAAERDQTEADDD